VGRTLHTKGGVAKADAHAPHITRFDPAEKIVFSLPIFLCLGGGRKEGVV